MKRIASTRITVTAGAVVATLLVIVAFWFWNEASAVATAELSKIANLPGVEEAGADSPVQKVTARVTLRPYQSGPAIEALLVLTNDGEKDVELYDVPDSSELRVYNAENTIVGVPETVPVELVETQPRPAPWTTLHAGDKREVHLHIRKVYVQDAEGGQSRERIAPGKYTVKARVELIPKEAGSRTLMSQPLDVQLSK